MNIEKRLQMESQNINKLNLNKFQNRVIDLICKDRLEKVIELYMTKITKKGNCFNTEVLDMIVLFSGELTEINNKFDHNLIHFSDVSLSRAKVRKGLVTLTKNLSEKKNKSLKKDVVKKEIVITISSNLNSFSKEDQELFFSAIKDLLAIDGELVIKRIEEGSIKITLELSEVEIKLLTNYFKEGRLEKLKVKKIEKATPKSIIPLEKTKFMMVFKSLSNNEIKKFVKFLQYISPNGYDYIELLEEINILNTKRIYTNKLVKLISDIKINWLMLHLENFLILEVLGNREFVILEDLTRKYKDELFIEALRSRGLLKSYFTFENKDSNN